MLDFKLFVDGSDKELINLYLNTKTNISEIAQRFGKTKTEIYRILHSHNIQPNRLNINREKVGLLYAQGWNIQEIAKFTGYTTRNVRLILDKSI